MSIFKKAAKPPVIEVHSAQDYGKLPSGNFLVKANGKRSYGHNGVCGLAWDVRRPPLTKEQLAALPVVRLNLATAKSGVARVGERVLVDSSAFESFSGEFEMG